jgi:hypothetical protein
MNRLEIRNLTRKRLGETTAAFWTDVELNTWIDDACDDLAFRTKCLRTNDKMTTVTDTAEYTLSTHFSDLLTIFDVYYYLDGSIWDKLDPTTRVELDITDPGWKSVSSGTPDRYYWSREEDVIGFFVKPNSTNAGTDYAEVYYAQKHTDITSDTAAIDIPGPLHNAISDYVVATGLDTRGWGDKSNDAWSKYFSKLKDYQIERDREREDDELIMKNYRNI